MEVNLFKRTRPQDDSDEEAPAKKVEIECLKIVKDNNNHEDKISYGMISVDGDTVKLGNKRVKCTNGEVAKHVVSSLKISHKYRNVTKIKAEKLSTKENIDKNKRAFDVRKALRNHQDFKDGTLDLGDGFVYTVKPKVIRVPKPIKDVGEDLKKEIQRLKEQLQQYQQHDREFTAVQTEAVPIEKKTTKEEIEALRKYMGL